MATQPFTVYTNAALELSRGSFDLASDTLAMILATDSYVPAPDTDATFSAISPFELASDLGYTQGGVTVQGLSDSASGGVVTFTCAPALWGAFSGTFRYAAIVKRDGAALIPADLLLCYADCSGGGSLTGAGGTLTITPDPAGILTIGHTP